MPVLLNNGDLGAKLLQTAGVKVSLTLHAIYICQCCAVRRTGKQQRHLFQKERQCCRSGTALWHETRGKKSKCSDIFVKQNILECCTKKQRANGIQLFLMGRSWSWPTKYIHVRRKGTGIKYGANHPIFKSGSVFSSYYWPSCLKNISLGILFIDY